MPITRVLAAIPVADMDAAQEWYGRLFDRPADDVPMAEAAEWRVVPGGSVQLVLDPDRAGRGMLTLGVDDIDGLAADLVRRGIAMTPADVPSGSFRIATVADPAGNQVTFGQDLRSDR